MSQYNKNLTDFLNNLVKLFFVHQMQIKMLHFQTGYYARHKATDNYLAKFSESFDKFMEVAQGISGKLTIQNFDLNFSVVNDENVIQNLNEMENLLRNFEKSLNGFTELKNIRDDMLSDLNQLKYLLTFK